MADDPAATPAAGYFSLDTAPEPEQGVTLNGVVYAMSTADDLSILAQEKLQRFYLKIREINGWEGADDGLLSDEQEQRINDLELRFCYVILPDAPRADIDAVPAHRRARLVRHFTNVVDQTPFLIRVMQEAQARLQAQTAARNAARAAVTAQEPPTPLMPLRQKPERGNGTGTTTTADAEQPTGSHSDPTESLAD